MKNQIRKGSIVVIQNGVMLGNPADTITKVISRPGELSDKDRSSFGNNTPIPKKHILVAAEDNTYNPFYLNKPAYYELIADLRPATEEEKKKFRKNNCKPILKWA